ncbi:MAG: gliding motility lipoprotein GldD [Flavobacteriaceae bacterium]|nr:gliding motility lipoprotein GldD [Flavobacteriaceae bacterium]
MWRLFSYSLMIFLLLGQISCSEDAVPKPYGDVRLEYPAAEYAKFNTDCPFSFQYSSLAEKRPKDSICAYNLYYPNLKATIYLTYDNVEKKGLVNLIRDAEKAVYEMHTTKAEYIEPKLIIRSKERVFGTLYELSGESAMNFQFHITDSVQHFLRGSVYFRSHPKPDSLAPAIEYMRLDIEKLMESARWK